jgi:hypothetical protein
MRALPLLALALLAACEDTLGIPDAHTENTVDTVSLWAVSGTSLERPSAYVIGTDGAFTVRTDRAPFDVAFDLDTAGRALLLPTGALDLVGPGGVGSGVFKSTLAFDSIKVAPGSGYQDTVAVELAPDDVAVIRSRPIRCIQYFAVDYFFYAKLRVLAVDLTDRRMDLEVLANTNCGYSSLEPGLPRR